MNTSMLQNLLLAVILLASAIMALRQLAPGAFRRMQGGVAQVLSRPRLPAVVRRLGYWLQPEEARKGQCGSGLGCASCAGCGVVRPDPGTPIPLKFNPRPIRPAG